MAITPRILFHNPAVLAVASVTMFGLSVMAFGPGLTHCKTAERDSATVSTYTIPCTDVATQLGDQQQWQEEHWAYYTLCFQDREDWRLSETIASDGLRHFPASEMLWNMKALGQINQGHYRDAVKTLEQGLTTYRPTNGTSENNLAWAGLWVEGYSLDHARGLYQKSLQREAKVCEVLHTGLMVEFAISQRTSGFAQAEAYRNFQNVRSQYALCESRIESGQWDDFVEVSGAYALFHQVDRQLGITYNLQTSHNLRTSVRTRDAHFMEADFGTMCTEAMPTQLNLRSECKEGFETRAERMNKGVQDARVVIRR